MHYVYHAVTERPMAQGQTIIFDQHNFSGVHARVMMCKRMMNGEKFEGELADYIKANYEKCKKVTLRELALEEIRKAEFPHYPSRMACLYTTRNYDEAVKWAKYFQNLGRKVYSIVKLRVDGNIFDGDACNCFDGTDNESENIRKARGYWKMDVPNEKPIIETLVDGKIYVEEVMEEFI